jgi:GTP-binding protein LepA
MAENIRNFVIIAHIDHGKSTLADRFLEITGTVPPRQMKPQYLDQLELERERGITIKMAPVKMTYRFATDDQRLMTNILNLIDTPGHSDFSYEVSRALRAVEGAILLVDATQGIQAQTLANFEAARKCGLKILGCVNKIDLNPPELGKVIKEVAGLINCAEEEIYQISAKSGKGVEELLKGVIQKIPPPKNGSGDQALIFDSIYDDHKGIIAYVRVFSGSFFVRKETELLSVARKFLVKEVGIFSPKFLPAEELSYGEIGYIATGIKDPGVLRIGDTIGNTALAGYTRPQPVVFVSLYPEEGDEYDNLKKALNKLRLIDSSISLEPDFSEILGRGFRAGFLGRLHFEIAIERLSREFGVKTITSFPSVAYRVKTRGGEITVESPKDFPEDNLGVREPVALLRIITPQIYLGKILNLKETFRFSDIATESVDDRIIISLKMPLSELVSDFDDKLKSISLGYASFSYEFWGFEPAEVSKLEVLVADETVPGLARIIYKPEIQRVSRKIAEELKEHLPRKLFVQAIQVKALGRITARENVPALKKDVTGHLYGGDRSRKMKLWKKQKAGKKRLKKVGRVVIPPQIFKELLKR